MPARPIILAHAADTAALAAIIDRRFSALGYQVDRLRIDQADPARPRLRETIDEAKRVIVLWSRAAAGGALEAALRQAEDAGKLAVVRLASSPTPPRLRARVSKLPRPSAGDEAWRALADSSARRPHAPPADAPAYPGSRWHGMLVAVLMAMIAAGAAYETNRSFAARVDALASAIIAGGAGNN